jgi:hypothetical protein
MAGSAHKIAAGISSRLAGKVKGNGLGFMLAVRIIRKVEGAQTGEKFGSTRPWLLSNAGCLILIKFAALRTVPAVACGH